MTDQRQPHSRPHSQPDSQPDSHPVSRPDPQPAESLIGRLLAPDPPPFAVLHRPHISPDTVELLIGDLITVELLADLPEPAAQGLPVLAVVPYRQIRERGFEAVDDGAPLLALRTHERTVVALTDLLPLLPDGPQTFIETGYDVPDAEYEASVRAVLDQEIAAGAGSNFVIHRSLTGRLDGHDETPARAALGALKRLLVGERRAYWTFIVHTSDTTFVGATPERHVSLDAGVARMNPISGTLRYPAGGWAGEDEYRQAVLSFLADPKERDELAMVVDEELKMMAVVGDRGGRVRGPYLKEMAHLAHTEYVIEGQTSFDVRDVLAATMFAPTVTGSPIRNACRVIARHELRGRRYYGGVLALIGLDDEGRQSLDAPILIRTAEIASDGSVRVPAGATLVRGSRPASELAETRSKAAAIVSALQHAQTSQTAQTSPVIMHEIAASGDFVHDHGGVGGGVVRDVLADRNRTLARFWLQEQGGGLPAADRATSGHKVTVIDAEDDFTGMLAHQLRSLGFEVAVHPWHVLDTEAGAELTEVELVVLGPGPGDPRDLSDPRIHALHALAKARIAAKTPLLGICLGHQIMAHTLGLTVHRLPRPDQGRQSGIDLFGSPHRVGFYNSYVAHAPTDPMPGFSFSLDGASGRINAFRGEALTGLQFHPESVLTTDGLEILDVELARLVG
jgi:2-amino-4-deoxychorismate synthase